MERTGSSTYDPAAPSEGAIELLLELGGLSLPMQGVACGLLAAECASNMLVRTLSGTRTSEGASPLQRHRPSWWESLLVGFQWQVYRLDQSLGLNSRTLETVVLRVVQSMGGQLV